MIKLNTPKLPPWKVVPKNIIRMMDAIHKVKHATRCPDTAATAVRALACVEQVYPFGVVVAHLSVKFKGNWEYLEATVELGEEFDPLPWEW